MRMHRWTLVVLALLFSHGLKQQRCQAEWIFLGPTPYLSKADSPFPVDGSNPNFYLEDFEPDEPCVPDENTFCGGGQFDAPGVRMIYGGTGHGFSVDADDGEIDGSGARGHSAGASDIAIIGSSTLVELSFEFDFQELGFFPIAVGFVLTDGAGPGSGIGVYDANGNIESFLTFDIDLDPFLTSDDRFVGVINPDGISRIEFVKRIADDNPTATPRIDHFQYGLIVPEPSALLLLTCAACALGLIGRSTRLVLTLVITLTLSAASANAELIRFEMTGTVTIYDPTFVLPADVVTGVPFTACLTYDTSVPDSLPENPREGLYHLDGSGTEYGLTLLVGNLLLRNDPSDSFHIHILDDAPMLPGFSAPSDSLRLRTVSSLGGPPSLLEGLQMIWDNPNRDSWNFDALPTFLNPSQFARATISAFGADEQPPLGRPYDIIASVTEVVVIPEPATAALVLSAAIVALLIWRFMAYFSARRRVI